MTDIGKLGLLGTGNMGSALVRGVLNFRLLDSDSVFVADIDRAKAGDLADNLCVSVADDNAALLAESDVVIIAVKPQGIVETLEALRPHVDQRHLFISIAAGVPLEMLEGALTPEGGAVPRVIRTMPNTPSMLGLGATGVAAGTAATKEDIARALAIFEAVGVAVEVPEEEINAVTGLSGSGPAYVFRFIEALTEAGRKAGLDGEVAAKLARQTVLGAATMASERGADPADLRERVTSPGGTTEAGLKIMNEGGFMELMARTVQRATDRGAELCDLLKSK